MKIYVQVKSVGKRRPILQKVPYEIPDSVSTLESFLTEIVCKEVEAYNQKGCEVQLIPFLTKEEVEDEAAAGRVSFGRLYSDRKADQGKAVENALKCFQDGLVRVFQNEKELTELKDIVTIEEEDCFTFIRLTFLSGRLW